MSIKDATTTSWGGEELYTTNEKLESKVKDPVVVSPETQKAVTEGYPEQKKDVGSTRPYIWKYQ